MYYPIAQAILSPGPMDRTVTVQQHKNQLKAYNVMLNEPTPMAKKVSEPVLTQLPLTPIRSRPGMFPPHSCFPSHSSFPLSYASSLFSTSDYAPL